MLPANGVPAIATAMDRSVEVSVEFVRARENAIADASVVVCQLEVPPETVLETFRIARRHAATTILNPAPAVPVDAALFDLCDVLVPNEHEAATLAGEDAPPAELALLLHERLGAGAVVVTAGEDGAFATIDGTVEHVAAAAAHAVDTTGAGDGFVGALATRLRAGEPLLEATRFAVRAATIKVQREGTMPSFATAEEVLA
jgi:ribokinase